MKWRALFLTLLLGLSVAAAASLQLTAPQRPYATTDQRCVSEAALLVSQTTLAFDLPEECEGLPGQIRVKTTEGERIVEIPELGQENFHEVDPKIKDFEKIYFSADTWPVRVSWEYDPEHADHIEIECVGECYLKDLQIRHPQDSPPYYHVTGKIATDSIDPVEWKLIFNASSDLLPFLAGKLATDRELFKALEVVDCDADPRKVEIGPTDPQWEGRLEAGKDITFGFYGWETAAGGGGKLLFNCAGTPAW